jgi:hypothetical protein
MESIVDGETPVDLQKSLSKCLRKTQSKNSWFVRLSTRSIKDSFYQQKPIPLESSLEILERLLNSKKAFIDIRLCLEHDMPISLFLVEWDHNMNIHHEFRCFVRNGHLIAISQYDLYNDLDFMEYEIPNLVRLIKHKIHDVQMEINNHFGFFVIDLLVLRNKKTNNVDKVDVIEINPYDKSTSGIYFSWKELNSFEIGEPIQFRYKLYGGIKNHVGNMDRDDSLEKF